MGAFASRSRDTTEQPHDAHHHVLLIGIDSYPGNPLFGCVNDIDAIQRLLIDRVGVARDRITRLVAPHEHAQHATDVPSQLPTLANLRAALARLGSDEVAPGDRVFIYYSGHGTQATLDDGRGRRFTREALVPIDEIEGGLLFDWELNHLVAAIAARTHAVTVVLDACSSAGITRGDRTPAAARHRFKRTERVHTLASSQVVQPGLARGVGTALGSVQRCQVIAACRDDQRAQESPGDDGRSHGELTRALLRHLAAVGDHDLLSLHWGRIWRAVEAEVRNANPLQHPWLAGSFGRRVFGFGPDEEGDHGYAIYPVDRGFRFDVGVLDGVTDGARIGVYGPLPAAFPPLDSREDLAARLFTLEVTLADRSSSFAAAASPPTLPPGARGRLVAPGKSARLRVGLLPDDAELDRRLQSDLIELVPAGDAELILERRPGGWELTDGVFGDDSIPDRAILAVIPLARLDRARAMVEHYHAYTAPLRLAEACDDLPSMLQISMLDCGRQRIPADRAQNPDLPELEVGADGVYEIAHGARLCFVVRNASHRALSVGLVDCGASGRVFILGTRRLPANSQHVFWANDTLGEPFVATAPDRASVGIDRLVAIGTTRTDRSLAHLTLRTSFADVLTGVTRGTLASRSRGQESETEQWTASVATVRTRRGMPAS